MPKQGTDEGIELQPRDEELMRGLLDCRIMTIKHAAALHFDGRFEAAKKRLQKLNHAGFIAPRTRRVQDPALLSLTRKGYMSLKEDGMLDPLLELGWEKMQDRIQVSESLLRHELAVMDVKAALAPAITKQDNFTLKEFTVTPERHALRTIQMVPNLKKRIGFRSIIAKPDGFLHVKECRESNPVTDHHFFLEVDRGTETLRRLVKKAGQYSQYYRNGSFAAKLGFAREDFRRYPFRVLVVVMTAERRNNVAEKLVQAKTPLKTMIWITTMQELIANPLGAIWMRPLDYFIAVQDSTFETSTKKKTGDYRRDIEREAWIEANAAKHRLLGE